MDIIDENTAKYPKLYSNAQLFALKYKLYHSLEGLLRAEIETQKRFFLLQQAEQREEKC